MSDFGLDLSANKVGLGSSDLFQLEVNSLERTNSPTSTNKTVEATQLENISSLKKSYSYNDNNKNIYKPTSLASDQSIDKQLLSPSSLLKKQQPLFGNYANQSKPTVGNIQTNSNLRQLKSNLISSNNNVSSNFTIESPTKRLDNAGMKSNTFAFPSSAMSNEKPRKTALSRMSSHKNFKDRVASQRHSRMMDENNNSSWGHHLENVNAIPIKTPRGHKKSRSIDSNDDTHSLHSVSSSLTASFSTNFLSGFYKNKIRRRKKGQIVLLSEKYWMKDDNCKECFYCAKTFYAFRRKHHCRLCGQIFCSSCAYLVPGEKFGYDHKLRFCKICLEHLENEIDSSDDDYSVVNETLEVDEDENNEDETIADISDILPNNFSTSVHFPDNDGLDYYSKATTDMASIFGEDDSKFLTESFNPPKLAIPARKTGETLAIETASNLRPRSYSHHYLTPTKDVTKAVNPATYTNGNTSISSNFGGQQNFNLKMGMATPVTRTRNRNLEKHLYHNSKHNLVQSQIFPENKVYWEEANNFNNSNDFSATNNHNRLTKVKSDMSLGKFSSFFTPSAYDNNKSLTANRRNLSPPLVNSTDVKANESTFSNPMNIVSNHLNFGPLNSFSVTNKLHKSLSRKIGSNDYSETAKNLTKDDLQQNASRNSYIDENDLLNNVSFYNSEDDEEEEDEASMSIFAALNNNADSGDKKVSFDFTNNTINNLANKSPNIAGNSIFRNRLDPDANKRAEASLKRIKSKRKSRQRPTSTITSSTGGYLSSNIFNQSNILSNKQLQLDNAPSINGNIVLSNFLDNKVKTDIPSSFDDHVSGISETLLHHLRLLITQTLEDQGVEESFETWVSFFENLVVSLDAIKIHTKLSDSLDYRQYVKIKRICGGHISDSKFVDGIIFSKNVPTRTMSTEINKPKILLLMFPIVYEKAKDNILSLEVLLTQEKQYLNSLVSRILALNPDLVFVSDNVAGEALKLLEDAGITCQFNIKPQVIEKISKFTEADVVNSVDKLMVNVKLGICDQFCVKTYKFGSVLKSYSMLTGCNIVNGGTILLRGLDDKGLRKIKNAVEFVTYAILSLRFESCFLKDSLIKVQLDNYKKSIEIKQQQVFSGIGAIFLENFNKRLMTTSPGVSFPIPFLLERCRYLENKIIKLSKLKEDINVYTDEEFEKYCENKFFLLDIQKKGKLSSIEVRYYTQLILEKQLQSLQGKLNNKVRQWNIFYSINDNILGIGLHQSMSVIYSMISYKTGIPCIGPVTINIEYYWDNDVTLGQFIENVVTTVDYPCSSGCGGGLIDHYRTYVNGTAKVDVIVERLSSKVPSLKNIILMWSYCKKCKHTTPVLKMDADSWNHSFGKYMELVFWGNETLSATAGDCTHDVFKDQIKYFGYNDVVIRLEWSSIEVHSIVTPRQLITWKPQKDILIKIELLSHINDQVEKLYDSIINRLSRVKLDSSIEELNIEGRAKSLELQNASINEKEIFIKYANEVYMNTPGTDHLSLNSVLTKLYSKMLTWMTTISEFEKKYLPSEKDIARITSNQLKKLFLEAKPEDHSDREKLDFSLIQEFPKETKSEEPVLKDENFQEASFDTHRLLIQEHSASDSDILKMIASQEMSPIDDEALHSESSVSVEPYDLPQQPNNILSRHLRTMSQTGEENNVERLASHFNNIYFDNLSKEFEHQRELERRNFRKKYYSAAKSGKIQDSKPKVEVFQNVMEAVEETVPSSAMSVQHNRLLSLKKDSSIGTNSFTDIDKSQSRELQSKNTTTSLETANKQLLKVKENDICVDDYDEPKNLEISKNFDKKNPSVSLISDRANKEHQEEKGSLLQLLKNFWADRSSALWEPLHSPILPTEHIFDNNVVIIREDEPSSIISFCLNSNEYNKKMEQTYVDYAAQINLKTSNQMAESGKSHINLVMEDSDLIEAVMNKPSPIHLRYQVEDENILMSCKIFFADQFDALRRASGCHLENSSEFIQSLSRCFKWDSSGGKSGSVFLKTLDDRFVLKEMSGSEVDAFVQFAPNYFKYMSEAIYQKLPTVIAKIVGFFQIQFKNMDTGKSVKLDCIITENLFYGKKNVRIFDLKGSMRNRHVEKTGKENEVLLDENMVEYIYESPIFVREYDKKLLRASVWNDTLFLSKMNVMDYSLVIGIDNKNGKLFVGIIDCIRTFTWDKKLESWVKEKGLVGGGTKEPTVVTPRQYKNRFREAMERYILMVPDPWSKQENKK
ncbi:hypothetical protein QEN19_003155 [Hanseniaspora menglaensis]